jgi:hypothetical protein
MQRVIEIAVDVDDRLRLFVTNAGAIGLAHRARADGDQQFGLGHRIIAADRALRAADMHVLRMCIRQHAGRAGRQRHCCAGGFRQTPQGRVMAARTAAGLDDDAAGLGDHRRGLIERNIVRRRHL